MLRRPITTLSITAEDVADFEDRRAEQLEAQRAMRRRVVEQGIIRDPRLHRITGAAHPAQTVRGHAAGWEYDSAEEDEGDEEGEMQGDEDQDEGQLPYSALPPRDRAMQVLQAGLVGRAAGSDENDGGMDIDRAPPRAGNASLGRPGLHATPVAAAGGPVTPVAPGAPGQGGHPAGRAARSPSEPPDGGVIRTRIRVGRTSRATREERIGVAPGAPERRRRQQGPIPPQGGS